MLYIKCLIVFVKSVVKNVIALPIDTPKKCLRNAPLVQKRFVNYVCCAPYKIIKTLFQIRDVAVQFACLYTLEELHLCTFKTPPSGAVMSERGDTDCAFSMCNGVKWDILIPRWYKFSSVYIFKGAQILIFYITIRRHSSLIFF